MLDDPLPDQVDTENFDFILSLSDEAESYEFITEQDVEALFFEDELTIHFRDDEDTRGIRGDEPETKVRDVVSTALDRDAVESRVEEKGAVKVGRIRVSTSSGTKNLLVVGELNSTFTDDAAFDD